MSESAFWSFSLSFYARRGVPELCLELQDRHGVDVNVLLYLLFLATQGRRLEAAEIDAIEHTAADWRSSVVRPLRSIRRALKADIGPFDTRLTAAFRDAVKGIELEAERLQQLTLERLAARCASATPEFDSTACARRNVELYAAKLGGLPADTLDRLLIQFGERSREEAPTSKRAPS